MPTHQRTILHSAGISVVTEMRDRKEDYGQSEPPACNGDCSLRFAGLSRYTCNNIRPLHRVGNTSNLEWRRRYPGAKSNALDLSESAMSQPDPPPNLPNHNPGKIPLSTANHGLSLDSPFSPFFSLTFVWTQLYLFIVRTFFTFR